MIQLVHLVQPVLRISLHPGNAPGHKIGFVLIVVGPVHRTSMNQLSVPSSTTEFVQNAALVIQASSYLNHA